MDVDSKLALAKMTGAKISMLSWARDIESPETVPDVYQLSMKKILPDHGGFPHTVLAPAMNNSLLKVPERLIVDTDQAVHILERTGSRVVAKEFPLASIYDLENGVILLHSWITLHGAARDGTLLSSTFGFNTASARHFTPMLEKIRPTPGAMSDAEFAAEQAKFDALHSVNFKFMNFARSSLVRGEKIRQTIWQPEVREKILSILGRSFHRTQTTAHLTILTDKELILIRDDERVYSTKKIRYGGVWRYLPLRAVTSVSWKMRDDGLWVLSIALAPHGQVERIFEASAIDDLKRFRDGIGGQTNRA